MKKYFSILLVTFFISSYAFAQVEIDNAGNVGIGIATPTQQLDVNGILRVRNIPLDNSFQQFLVQDPIGNVHYRDFASFNNWTRIADTVYSDTVSYVYINGKTRTRIGNSLLDICPIPGPPVGIGGGIDLIFNKDNVCVGLWRWEEKVFIPDPTLPDPVFKLFPRTGGTPTSAPGFEFATFDTVGLGLDGIRMLLCPSPLGPFPAWENPRIDLRVDNTIEVNPGGDAGGLRVGNLGSSGQDGVSVESIEETIFRTLDVLNSKVVDLRMKPEDTVLYSIDSFFDVYTDLTIPRLRVLNLTNDTVQGTGVLLEDAHQLSGLRPGVGGGSIILEPDITQTNRGSKLKISNLGSSGCDGVSIALPDTVFDTEMISMQLSSIAPNPAIQLGTPELITNYEYDPLNRLVTRTVDDLNPISQALPHTYTYDGLNRLIKETGPQTRSYEHNQLVSTYSYDPLGRRISRTYSDTIGTPHVYTYDANSNTIGETGPDFKSYESNLLRHTTIYNDPQRTVTETWSDILLGGPGQSLEFDFFNNVMRLLHDSVRVEGNLHVAQMLTAAIKLFTIDHPLDPYNKNLMHVSVESPDMMNIYNGNIKTDEKGVATVTMPDYFSALNMDFRYQLTTIGQKADAWIAEEISKNTFKIETEKPNVKVSWQVTGIRNDAYARENRVQVEVEKDKAMKGKLLYEPKTKLGLNTK